MFPGRKHRRRKAYPWSRADTSALVAVAYQGMLQREPTAQEAQLHEATLRWLGPGALRKVIVDIVESAEFESRRAGLSLASPADGPASGRPTTHMTSIGPVCLPAQFLKDQGLRLFSGPFDWVFSSVPMVAHCLRDDFREFLSRAHYESAPPDDPADPAHRCRHEYYGAHFGKHLVFNHHDPTIDGDYDYFVRSVRRFRQAVQSPAAGGRTLLLHIDLAGTLPPEEFLDLCHAVDAYSQGNAFVVAIVCMCDEVRPPGPRLSSVVGLPSGHRLLQLAPAGEVTSVAFVDPADRALMVELLQSFDLQLAGVEDLPSAAARELAPEVAA